MKMTVKGNDHASTGPVRAEWRRDHVEERSAQFDVAPRWRARIRIALAAVGPIPKDPATGAAGTSSSLLIDQAEPAKTMLFRSFIFAPMSDDDPERRSAHRASGTGPTRECDLRTKCFAGLKSWLSSCVPPNVSSWSGGWPPPECGSRRGTVTSRSNPSQPEPMQTKCLRAY